MGASIAPAKTAAGMDVQDVQEYWKKTAKYEIKPSMKEAKVGKWQVRLTAEGSKWLSKYNKVKGFAGKVAPNEDAGTTDPSQLTWEQWVKSRIAFDRWEAADLCRAKNKEAGGSALPPQDGIAPISPGPCPAELMLQIGDAPKFAAAVVPHVHEVVFEDGTKIALEDNPAMRSNYTYYRFPQGVNTEGTQLTQLDPKTVDTLFETANLNGSIQRVMCAISPLEGGFDSFNTYDTGFVSVGFIQFASLAEGKGSLGELMGAYKTRDPFTFDSDFRRYGIDVTFDNYLSVVNLGSGKIVTGSEAAMEIIEDKRLAAVFVRAGRLSNSFRVSQLQVARNNYYPADDKVKFAGRSVVISDIIRSEAGMATLMDRKVNTGNLSLLSRVCAETFEAKKLTDPMDLGDYESQIISRMKWRKSFLGDKGLSQPAASQ
ncbi:MAG: hypothetical protein K8R88_04440 [Armatimonadetes bacterium]|nr:hypothetical protein [Armatimonadota bacterium]